MNNLKLLLYIPVIAIICLVIWGALYLVQNLIIWICG